MEAGTKPYVGPQPFQRKDRDLFFGRDYEAGELMSLVIARGLVLVYAPSGAGKTSLINARLIPMLEEEGFDVLEPARMRGLIPPDIKVEQVRNPYVFNALLSWADKETRPADLRETCLHDFLQRRKRRVNAEGTELPRALIFDQFEELFTAYQERWEDRTGFFREADQALGEDRLLRILFVMREEYVAQFDRYASLLPDRVRTRFRLESLRQDAALMAVTGPVAKAQTGRSFAEGVAEKLVEDLLKVKVITDSGEAVTVIGESVEPVQLQVVCENIWQRLKPEETVITQEHLRDFGDVNEALSRLYENAIGIAARESGVTEGALRRWFESALITTAGTRGHVYLGKEKTGGIPNAAIQVLEDQRLIRGEFFRGAPWYELAHDRFIEPVQKSNSAWLSQHAQAEQARQRLEARAADWAEHGRAAAGLLQASELEEAERWMQAPEAKELGYSELLRALVDESRAEQHRVEERQRYLEQQAKAAKELRRLTTELRKERNRAQRQALVSFSRELAAAAMTDLTIDPERSILLALHALEMTYGADQTVIPEVVDALHRSLQVSRVQKTLSDHTSWLRSVTYSPDGARLATGSDDRTARIWDVASGKTLLTLQHPDCVYAGAFSPDGKRLVTGSLDGRVKIWDSLTGGLLLDVAAADSPGGQVLDVNFSPDGARVVVGTSEAKIILLDARSGEALFTLDRRDTRLHNVVFSPDGSGLAASSADVSVERWDLGTRREQRRLEGHQSEVFGLVFSADGSRLFSGSMDYTVRLWKLETGEAPTVFSGHSNTVFAVALGGEERWLATASGDGTAKLWEVASGQELATFSGHTNPVFDVAFHPNGKQIATASFDGTVRLWNASLGHRNAVNDVAFSPDGTRVASGSRDKTARLWDAASHEELLVLSGHEGVVENVEFSRDGAWLATASQDGAAKLWDARRGMELLTLRGHRAALVGLRFNADASMLATLSKDKTIKLWRLPSGQETFTLAGHSAEIEQIGFSADGRFLASASEDNTAKLWDTTTGALVFTMSGHTAWVRSVAFGHDGKFLVTSSDDGTIKLWDAGDGHLLLTLAEHTGFVFDVRVSRSGIIASASADRTVKLWDASSGSLLRTLTGHNNMVYRSNFSPDGKMLATASGDRTAKLWDVSSGNEIRTFNHFREVANVVFSPDGKRLATNSEDEFVRIYELDVQELMNFARTRVTRELTPEERRKYLHDGQPGSGAAPRRRGVGKAGRTARA